MARERPRKPAVLSELPMTECPHCGEEFQWDDYYDVKTGDEHTCPICEETIHVIEAYTTMFVRLSTEAGD